MTNSTNTTRRGFLSTAALAASAARHPDRHCQRVRSRSDSRGNRGPQGRPPAFENAVSRGSRLDEQLPGEKTRSWITVWEQTIVETDDPRWIDSVREVHRTSDAETDARLRSGKHRSDHNGRSGGVTAIHHQHPARGMAGRRAVR